jgi:putative ABC transport system ATP-binding protein
MSLGLSLLEARGLHRFYRRGETEVAALLDVSLSCRPGETVAVVGPSGSGKSTLLSLLAGLDDPDGGAVRIAGELISHSSASRSARIRARHLGVLTQSSGLLGHLSVLDNVRFAASLRPRRGPVPDQLLDDLGIGETGRRLPRTLSGGEAARAGLAVALAGAPSVLLADEPTAELNAEQEAQLLDLLDQWRPLDGATVLVTHAEAVMARADRVLRLVDGRMV